MSSPATDERNESVRTPMSAADIHANARALSGYLREKSDSVRPVPRSTMQSTQ
ncbi:MAG: hypothetical protein ACLQAT_24390 [Candidatus Binataceae bacterium]